MAAITYTGLMIYGFILIVLSKRLPFKVVMEEGAARYRSQAKKLKTNNPVF